MTPSELTNLLEVHYEIVDRITFDLMEDSMLSNPMSPFTRIYAGSGRGALYEIAEELTLKFQEKYKDYVFDGDFFDLLDAFMDEETAKL